LVISEKKKNFHHFKHKLIEWIMGASYQEELTKWYQSRYADEVSFNATGLFYSWRNKITGIVPWHILVTWISLYCTRGISEVYCVAVPACNCTRAIP
jgi:hypothetical protein